MIGPAATAEAPEPAEAREAARALAGLWWGWLLVGIAWIVVALVVLQFDRASITTIQIIVGIVFAGLAEVLGFLFLCVGLWWTIRAFLEKEVNPVWWLGLVSGVLMVILAFWTSGQFFLEEAYVLLVFAGIWALMQGVTDIVRAFKIRSLRDVI